MRSLSVCMLGMERNLKRQLKRQVQQETRKRRRREDLQALNQTVRASYHDSSASDADVSSADDSDRGGGAENVGGAHHAACVNDRAASDSEDGSEGPAQLGGQRAEPEVHQEERGQQELDDNFDGDGVFNQLCGGSESSANNSGESDNDAPQFPTSESKEAHLVENITEWARAGGTLSMTKLDNLLVRLNPAFPSLPRTYKTLLGTPKSLQDVRELPDGSQMWYKGISVNLSKMDLQEHLKCYGKIEIDVNMDGLPLSRNSKKNFGLFWAV